MLLPSAKRAKLKSNEVCNAVRPNENSTLAFKNVLRCCANIIAIAPVEQYILLPYLKHGKWRRNFIYRVNFIYLKSSFIAWMVYLDRHIDQLPVGLLSQLV